MLARHSRFPKLCKTLVLVLLTTSSLAVAAPSGNELRRLNTERSGPIGKLYSLGAVIIDGHPRSGEQWLWGGEQVWAKEASVSIHLDGVGQVLLYRESLARLSMSATPDRAVNKESVLTVMVAMGEVAVSLMPDAGAHVVIGDTVYRASRGAKFKVRPADRRVFEVKDGEITKATPQQEPEYIVIPVLIDPKTNRPTGPGPDSTQAEAKKQRSVAVQPKKKPTKTTHLTNVLFAPQPGQQADSIVVGLRVEFCLESNPTIGYFTRSGSFCETAETDQDGVAKVVFQAGPNPGSSTVRASVVTAPRYFWLGRIEVVKGSGFWTPRNIIILAAAGAGAFTAFKLFKPQENGPLRQAPPPMIP